MRLTLIDGLIVLLLLNLGTAPSLLVRNTYPQAVFIGLPLGIALLLFGGSWIYRRCGILPMLLPRCPHCYARERFMPADRFGERWKIVCANCRGAFVYWTSRPPLEYRPAELAEVQVGFPYIFGPTRVTWRGIPTEGRQPELTGESYTVELRTNQGPFPVSTIAGALKGPRVVVHAEEETSVSFDAVLVQLRPEVVYVTVKESDCALANARATLRAREWLETLEKVYGPLRIRLDEHWRGLGDFLMFGE
ncbi:MAG: hypothetical protein KIS61_16710 [Candidatus Eremiobacteraeota bacterium]|nr:hypothetical protein [Candidatus Eremiobacteraeota bacterium]